MAAPHGFIPGYRPGPILSGPKRAFVASIFILPIGAYAYLRLREMRLQDDRLLLERQGRQNWDAAAKNSDQDLSVQVGRSGGGV